MNSQELFNSLKTLVTREIRRFMRIWAQTLLPPIITTSLYFVIFGQLIGERIGSMGGYSYIQFVVPGLIMMAVIQNSYSNVVSSFFGAKFQHHIEELLVSPTPTWIILLGFTLGGMARGLIVGVIVTAVSLAFTDLEIEHLGLTVLIVLMTSLLFSLAGLVNAVFANTFDDISIIPTFVLTPLIYLGGVFYSIDLLSEFWGNVSKINPVLYMVNAFRYGVLGVSDIDIRFAFVMIIGFVVVLWGYAMHLLNTGKRIRH